MLFVEGPHGCLTLLSWDWMGKIVLSLRLVIWLTIHFLRKQIPKGRQLDLTLSLLQTPGHTISKHHQMCSPVHTPTSQLFSVRAQWPLWKSVSSLLILEITQALHWFLCTFQEDSLVLSFLAFVKWWTPGGSSWAPMYAIPPFASRKLFEILDRG